MDMVDQWSSAWGICTPGVHEGILEVYAKTCRDIISHVILDVNYSINFRFRLYTVCKLNYTPTTLRVQS
jgi:hypothetical protein